MSRCDHADLVEVWICRASPALCTALCGLKVPVPQCNRSCSLRAEPEHSSPEANSLEKPHREQASLPGEQGCRCGWSPASTVCIFSQGQNFLSPPHL